MGGIECPTEFQGQHDPATMNLGDLFVRQTWDCFHQSQSVYARRYMSVGGAGDVAQRFGTLEEAQAALGENFRWCNVKFRADGGVLQWQSWEGDWIPVNAELSGNYQRCLQRGAPMPACHWHF
uniref:Uncharacterized protein n=1 Tax=Eutreptiella gymnastica TaxID=73025 RepID=A0A7S4LKT1_9EUGL